MISVLGGEEIEFPEGQELTKKLKDFLEESVDEKYYLSEDIQARFKQTKPDNGENNVVGTTLGENCGRIGNRDFVFGEKAPTIGALTATDYKQPKQVIDSARRLGGCFDTDKSKHQAGSVWDKDGLAPTLNTMQGGYRQPLVTYELPCVVASRGRNPENPSDRTPGTPTEQRLEPNTKGVANTLTSVQKDNYVLETPFRIRKLTPRECFRLMGLSDSDIDLIDSVGLSDSAKYKLAGNSIVKQVLDAIHMKVFI